MGERGGLGGTADGFQPSSKSTDPKMWSVKKKNPKTAQGKKSTNLKAEINGQKID